MPVGKESIKRAANAGAKKTVKKSVISTQDAEKMEGGICNRGQERNNRWTCDL